MKNLFTLVALVSFCLGSAYAQDQPTTSQTKVVVSKEALKNVAPAEATPVQNAQVERKLETAERIDVTQKRPVIEMTDEYIDHQIAEIQKVIDKNKDNKDFNLSGYQKRIAYLESRRPKN